MIDFFAFISMSVPALSDLIVLEKPSQSQEIFFSLFVDRSKHSGIEAGKSSLFKPIYLFRKLEAKLFWKSLSRSPIFSKFQANENIRGHFPLLVILKSWLLQDCSPSSFQVKFSGVAHFHWNLSLTTSNTAKSTAAS